MSDVLLEPSVAVFAPMESVDGLRPPSLPTGPTKTAEVSSKVSFMRAIPSRFHWTMWCPKKPGPAHNSLAYTAIEVFSSLHVNRVP